MRYLAFIPYLLLIASVSVQAEDQPKHDPNATYLANLSAAAAKGDPRSQVCLGAVYASGMTAQRDFDKALEWYKAAADQGDPEGKRRVAQVYMYGLGVKQDVTKAAAAFQKLTNQEYVPAYVDLALMYFDGNGVTENRKLAVNWLEKAAEAGNYDAQIRLAIKYHFGDEDLKKDSSLSSHWLAKAINQKIDCMPDYASIIAFIANASLAEPASSVLSTAGRVGIRFIYQDRRATNVQLMTSSGSKEFDDAWLAAVRATEFPLWPESYKSDDKMIGFWIGDDDLKSPSSFKSAVRDAIRDATVVPKDTLLYGFHGTNDPEVSFEYVNGKVSNVKILKSSDDWQIDAAAITAVETAHYPPPPNGYKNKKIEMQLFVNFGTYSPGESTATTASPAIATKTQSDPKN